MFKRPPVTGYIITLLDNKISTNGAKNCLESIKETQSEIFPVLFPAVKPTEVYRYLQKYNLEYTYPTGITRIDNQTGLILSPYKTKQLDKRIACFFSHYLLWKHIAKQDPREPFLILEHDAIFTRKFTRDIFDNLSSEQFIVGINDPYRATRKAVTYNEKMVSAFEEHVKNQKNTQFAIFPAPEVEKESNIPQGIAGNSAYIISRKSAEHLLTLTEMMGIWPNVALMCKQLVPHLLQIYPYLTKVQGLESTTSL